MNVAIVIAIEEYLDSSIRPVKYAVADAKEFAATLVQHGFDAKNQTVLVGRDATKTVVESRVRQAIAALKPEDVLYFYYAGHGFSQHGQNLITCHDSQYADLAATSIPLQWLFTQLKQSACKRLVFFLDSCASGIFDDSNLREVYSELTENELTNFFDKSQDRVCFASCNTGEESWSSGHLQHGIWANHLIEAFDGRAPLAFERNTMLTAASLQNHLMAAIPKSLREAFTDNRVQTPRMFGSRGQSAEFLLADLGEVLQRRRKAVDPNSHQVKRVALTREIVRDIRQLSGFKKGLHKVPERVTSQTTNFVASITQQELEEEIAQLATNLRSAFKLKRNGLRVDGPADGGATIITPDFTYSVSVSLNEEDPSEVVWHRQVAEIQNPDAIISQNFAHVFESTFDTVEFSPPRRFTLTEVIDRIEQLDDDKIEINYDHATTWCTLSMKGIDGTVHITADTFKLIKSSPQKPQALLKSFFDFQRALVDNHEVRLIAFDAVEE